MDFTQQLSHYYQHIYPTSLIYRFIRSTPNREFSCTLKNNVYIRYLSFPNSSSLSTFLLKKVPEKIDIGCIYTIRPDTALSSNDLIPMEKELVFDIDLTDYERDCCIGKTICNKCLVYVKCAARLMAIILKTIFNFNKILYCFSGSRGIHVHVCDKEAMALNNYARKAIVDFITVKNGMKMEELKSVIEEYEENDGSDVWNKMFVRLDKNVSVDMKHLLKAPFSIHPTSKKVSVPMSLEMLEGFVVEKMVGIDEVIEDDTLLKEYLDYFNEFVNKL